MTLIAGYVRNSCPVLLGDVIVSIPMGPGPNISTPSWDQVEAALNEPLQIVNMVQKVNIVHDHACFAWAGNYLQARAFATALRDHLVANDLDDNKMKELFRSWDKKDYDQLDCILYTVHDGILKRYHRNTGEYELDGLMVQTGGTGQGHFIKSVEHFFRSVADDDQREEAIVAPGLSYIAGAFGEQIFTGEGLQDGWGGAFELAYFANGRFQKVDDVLYLFWMAEQNEDGTFTLNSYPYLVKTNYFGDTFTVKVIDNTSIEAQSRVYNICPLGITDREKHNPSLSFSYLVNYVLIERQEGRATACVNLMTNASAKGFSVSAHGAATHLEFTKEFMANLCEQAFGIGAFREAR